MRKSPNSACFVSVSNHLLLSKSYEKTSGELNFGGDETTECLSWGETTLSWPGAKRKSCLLFKERDNVVVWGPKVRQSREVFKEREMYII